MNSTPPGHPIDGGGLVEIFRHADETGQHQQHDEGRPHPGVGEHDAGARAPDGPHQDERLAGEDAHRLRKQPEGGIVIVAEEGADSHERQHHRRQDEDHQVAPEGETVLEKSSASRNPTIIWALTDKIAHDDGVVQAVPQVRVGQNVGVLFAARPNLGCSRPIGPIGEEREAERPQQGEDIHQEKANMERRRDQEAADMSAPGVDHQRRREQRRERRRNPERGARRKRRDGQRHSDGEQHQRRRPVVPARLDPLRREMIRRSRFRRGHLALSSRFRAVEATVARMQSSGRAGAIRKRSDPFAKSAEGSDLFGRRVIAARRRARRLLDAPGLLQRLFLEVGDVIECGLPFSAAARTQPWCILPAARSAARKIPGCARSPFANRGSPAHVRFHGRNVR